MHASALLSGLAAAGLAAAMPAATPAPELAYRDADDGTLEMLSRQGDATAPWVKVNDDGQPTTTYTPVYTTDGGKTSLAHAAPHDLTADIYTWQTWEELHTRTGLPPNPTPTGKDGQGAFSLCKNMDGPYAPFCRPSHNSTLLTGNTYYVTWDPEFYNGTNEVKGNSTTRITVRLDFWNDTSKDWQKLKTFDKDTVPARFGFWPFKVEDKLLKGHKINNVTLTLLSGPANSKEKSQGKAAKLPLALTKPSGPRNPEPVVNGDGVKIGIPVALGGAILLIVGLCLWNRKSRRIQLGNIMSRSRNGYTGNRQRRRRGPLKDNSIQLDDTRLPDEPLQSPPLRSGGYRDDAPQYHHGRHDSDGLGSLAGTPRASFEQQGTTGGTNAFRDEMNRQNAERRNDNMI